MNFVRQLIDSVRGHSPDDAIEAILIALDNFELELRQLLDDNLLSNSEYISNLDIRAKQAGVVIGIVKRTNNDDSYHAIQKKETDDDYLESTDTIIH